MKISQFTAQDQKSKERKVNNFNMREHRWLSPQAQPTTSLYTSTHVIMMRGEKSGEQRVGAIRLFWTRHIYTHTQMKWTAGTHVPFPFRLVHSVFLTITRCGSRTTPHSRPSPTGNRAKTGCQAREKEILPIRLNQIDLKEWEIPNFLLIPSI